MPRPVRRLLPVVLIAILPALLSPGAPAGAATAPGNPLAGEKFFVDWEWGLAQRKAQSARGRKRALLMKIARQPETRRYGPWDGSVGQMRDRARAYVSRAAAKDAVPLLSTYRMPHEKCPDSDGGGVYQARLFKRWISALADAIGRRKAVVFLEIDATITFYCLNGEGKALRVSQMNYAAEELGRLPNTLTYMDAGASTGTTSPSVAAKILRRFGVDKVRGFFTNATHNAWTRAEIRYGKEISRRLGGKHFVINTAGNGRGPKLRYGRDRIRNGYTVRCNPPGRGLGPVPSTDTDDPLVDMYAWIGNPGKSAGACAPGAPPAGQWWEAYALELARNASSRLGP